MCAQSLNMTLCNPLGSVAQQAPLTMGFFRQWVAISSCTESSWPGDQTCISCIARWILYCWGIWEPASERDQQNRKQHCQLNDGTYIILPRCPVVLYNWLYHRIHSKQMRKSHYSLVIHFIPYDKKIMNLRSCRWQRFSFITKDPTSNVGVTRVLHIWKSMEWWR